MKVQKRNTKGEAEKGTVLVVVVIVVASLATLSLTMVTRTQATYHEARDIRELQSARYVAEAGLNAAYVEMKSGGDGVIGSEQSPMEFGGGTFWVENTALGGGAFELVAFGSAQGGEIRSQLVLRESVDGTPSFGVFGDEWLTFDSNAFVDSYDSSISSYYAQKVHKDGNDEWANENGDSGSNGNISLNTNAGIHGDATPGVESVTTIAGNSEVSGSTLPIEESFVMPTITIPSGTSSGDFIVTGATTIGPGTFFFDTLLVENNKDLRIIGPVTLVVDNLVLESNSTMFVNASEGGADIYVQEDFILNSNVILASDTRDPSDINVSITANNIDDPDLEVDLDMFYNPDATVEFDSNSKMFGTIVAPNAYIALDSNFELWGSLMARRLHLDSNSKIHFDEHLNASDETEEVFYDIVGWVELPGLD
jgi:hypothetical protein